MSDSFHGDWDTFLLASQMMNHLLIKWSKKVAEKGVWNLRQLSTGKPSRWSILSVFDTLIKSYPWQHWKQLKCWESGQLSVLLWSFGNNGAEGMESQSLFHQEEKTIGIAVQAGMEHQQRIWVGSSRWLSWWRPAALGYKGLGSSLVALIEVSCGPVPAILSSSTSGFHHIFCLSLWHLSYVGQQLSLNLYASSLGGAWWSKMGWWSWRRPHVTGKVVT